MTRTGAPKAAREHLAPLELREAHRFTMGFGICIRENVTDHQVLLRKRKERFPSPFSAPVACLELRKKKGVR